MTLGELEKLVQTTAVPRASSGFVAEQTSRACNAPPGTPRGRWPPDVVLWRVLWSEYAAVAQAVFHPREFETEAEAVACIKRRKAEAMGVWHRSEA